MASNVESAFIKHIQPKFKRGQKVWFYPLGKKWRTPEGKLLRRSTEIAEVKLIDGYWLYRLHDAFQIFPTFHYDTVLEASTP